MLLSLRIKNLALVEDLSLDFESGLTAITGETGAGKSILIGALGYLLGERADKSLIRSGESACTLEACLDIPVTANLTDLFESQGLELGDEALIIRRVIKQSGSGQILVNDQNVTLAFLKQLGNLLVDMHGPYDHQSLLHQEEQLALLDAYGIQAQDLLKGYRTLYQDLLLLHTIASNHQYHLPHRTKDDA